MFTTTVAGRAVGVGVGVAEIGVGVGVGVGTDCVVVAVGVGGMNPTGAGPPAAPTTRIRSPERLSASAAYANNGSCEPSLVTVAYPSTVTMPAKPASP